MKIKRESSQIAGRYSLVINGYNLKTQKPDSYVLSFKEKIEKDGITEIKGRKKVLLPYIDKITTQFNNGQELYSAINKKRPLPVSYGEFQITYQQAEKLKIAKGAPKRKYKYTKEEETKNQKTLPLIYKDQKELAEIAKVSKTKIDENNKTFNDINSRFMKQLSSDENFEKYINDYYNTYNPKFVEYIENRYENGKYGYRNDLYYGKIKTYMSSYKECRNIVGLMQKYDKDKKKTY